MSRVKLLIAALVAAGAAGTVGLVRARPVAAAPAPRARFTNPFLFQPAMLCAGPAGAPLLKVGVDVNGPYVAFDAFVGPAGALATFHYRPAGQVPNAVAQFGDGAIHATDMFRALFERWSRTAGANANVYTAGPRNLNGWAKPCWPGPGPAPDLQLCVDISSVMFAPVNAGAGAWPTLLIAYDPLPGPVTGIVNEFEDYEFGYQPK